MISEIQIPVNLGHKSSTIAAFFRQNGKDLLIFMHGLGGSKQNFSSVWDSPCFKNTSLLAFDFPGFGLSDKPEDFSYKMEEQAQVFEQVFAHFSDYRWHIAAHSMGGAIALLLPQQILDRVKSFADLEGNLIDADCFLSRKIIEQSFEDFYRRFLPRMKDRLADNPMLLEDINRALPMAYFKSAQSLVEWSDTGKLLEKFKDLSCRKAYFYGERNSDIAVLRRLDDIPGIEIPDSGHMMMMENPDVFAKKLSAFMELEIPFFR